LGVLGFSFLCMFFWFCCFLVFGHQTMRKQTAENPAWSCASQLRWQRVPTQAGALGWNPFFVFYVFGFVVFWFLGIKPLENKPQKILHGPVLLN